MSIFVEYLSIMLALLVIIIAVAGLFFSKMPRRETNDDYTKKLISEERTIYGIKYNYAPKDCAYDYMDGYFDGDENETLCYIKHRMREIEEEVADYADDFYYDSVYGQIADEDFEMMDAEEIDECVKNFLKRAYSIRKVIRHSDNSDFDKETCLDDINDIIASLKRLLGE